MAAAELQKLLARRKLTVDTDGLHFESAPTDSTADVQHSDETPTKAKEKLLGVSPPTVTPHAAKQIFERVDCQLSPRWHDSGGLAGHRNLQRFAQPEESASEDTRAPAAVSSDSAALLNGSPVAGSPALSGAQESLVASSPVAWTASPSSSVIDYSRWAHLESSDDEDPSPPPQAKRSSKDVLSDDIAEGVGNDSPTSMPADPIRGDVDVLSNFRKLIAARAWGDVRACFMALGSGDAFAKHVVTELVNDADCTSTIFESVAAGDSEAFAIVSFVLNVDAQVGESLVDKEACWRALVAYLSECDSAEGWMCFCGGFVVPAVKAQLPVLSAVYTEVHALCRRTMEQHLRRRAEIPAFDAETTGVLHFALPIYTVARVYFARVEALRAMIHEDKRALTTAQCLLQAISDAGYNSDTGTLHMVCAMLYAEAAEGHLKAESLLRIKMFADFCEETEKEMANAEKASDKEKKKKKKAQRGKRTA